MNPNLYNLGPVPAALKGQSRRLPERNWRRVKLVAIPLAVAILASIPLLFQGVNADALAAESRSKGSSQTGTNNTSLNAAPDLRGRLADIAQPSFKDPQQARIKLNPPYSDGSDQDSHPPPVRASAASSIPKVNLERVRLRQIGDDTYQLATLPNLNTEIGGKIAGVTNDGNYVVYSLDPKLQKFAQALVDKSRSPHVAIVAMEPATGRILALAGYSRSIDNIALHADFPAASLFKVITSAAALEQSQVSPYTQVRFRGGTYELERWNYLPSPKSDKRSMSLTEALGRSCNPVFGRIALGHLSPEVLRAYTTAFGFNQPLQLDVDLTPSRAFIPNDDSYLLSRTAAGFGQVRISPVHAAAMMSGLSNGGVLVRPYIIDSIYDSEGNLVHRSHPAAVGRIVAPDTAPTLLEMMKFTTTLGTSKRDFTPRSGSVMNGMAVAGKTGTLSGDNPKGLNHWFIGAAPVENPKIAVAVISVSPERANGRASYMARAVMEKFFGNPTPPEPYTPTYRKSTSKYSPKKKKRK